MLRKKCKEKSLKGFSRIGRVYIEQVFDKKREKKCPVEISGRDIKYYFLLLIELQGKQAAAILINKFVIRYCLLRVRFDIMRKQDFDDERNMLSTDGNKNNLYIFPHSIF